VEEQEFVSLFFFEFPISPLSSLFSVVQSESLFQDFAIIRNVPIGLGF
jgi:hypothetical protein